MAGFALRYLLQRSLQNFRRSRKRKTYSKIIQQIVETRTEIEAIKDVEESELLPSKRQKLDNEKIQEEEGALAEDEKPSDDEILDEINEVSEGEDEENEEEEDEENEEEEDDEALPEFRVYDEIQEKDEDFEEYADEEMAGIKRVQLPWTQLAPHSIVIPDDWKVAASRISSKSSRGASPIVVVCGPQNVGKSTFGRYLVNNLLKSYPKVGYLDTDVGQPEFTPPGILSLHILDKPNPDLLALCLRNPERSYFYGDVSPKCDPATYLYKVVYLYDHFRKNYYDSSILDVSESTETFQMPLVVNTMGWVKGIGYDSLVDMLRYMVPTHVVQIRLSALRKNLPFGFFWSATSELEISTELVYLGTAMKDSTNKSIVIQKHGREMRELRIVAYFRQCFLGKAEDISTYKELAHKLASHPPYQVLIHDIRILHLHCKVPESEQLFSLNGTIVGLAIDPTGKMQDTSDCACVGLGIVRGIDVSKGLFYILTPVQTSILEKVNVFLQGFLQIPTSLLKTEDFICPYISSNVISRVGTGSATARHGKIWNRNMKRGEERLI